MPASSPEAVLRRLDWTVLRRLDGILQGDYRTLYRGFGLDLADLREYQFGDDVRYIDWNVTARTDRPHVREFLEDRDLTAWFLLDLSPSLDFGTVRSQKRELLVDFVALLARLLTRHGNRVGAVLYTDKVVGVIPAGSGKRQVLRLINDLQRQPHLHRSPPTDLAAVLDAALRAFRRRSFVFIVSDFISLPGWERPLRLLSQRHEVLAVRLVDPRERELPDIGPVVLEDAETGEQIYVDTRDQRFRQRFAEGARRREYALAAQLGRAGVDLLSISTGDDLVAQIVRHSLLRKQKRRGTWGGAVRVQIGGSAPATDPSAGHN